ncbi:MAG: hypothetical protein ABIE68_01630 [bacterium]
MKQIAFYSLMGLLSFAVVGAGLAFAYGPNDSALQNKVAEKIGVDSETLQNAFQETHQEMHQEKIAAAVKNGELTQDEADLLNRMDEYRLQKIENLKADMAKELGVSETDIDNVMQKMHEAKLGGGEREGFGMGRGGFGMEHGFGMMKEGF